MLNIFFNIKDRRHTVSEFVKSFEDCTVPDSSKYGAGAVAFSKVQGDMEGNALLDEGKARLLASPLTRNLRVLSGLLNSFNSYDTPMEVNKHIVETLHSINLVTFFQKSLLTLFAKFQYAKIALQYLLVSTNGMTERELRLSLGKEEERSEWIEFCFAIEPAFVTRSGIFLKIANRHVGDALYTTFETDYQRIACVKSLIKVWDNVIMPANVDAASVLERGARERSSLLYRSWQAFPCLTSIDAKKYGRPTWEDTQLFQKAKSESRDELWTLLSSWPTFANSLKQISTKHQLFHYLKVLPKKKSDDNFLQKIQKSFVTTFKLPKNLFSLRNLFLGQISVMMFRPKNSMHIGVGLIELSFFIAECRIIFHKDVLSKLITNQARVPKTDLGVCVCVCV